MQAEIIAVGTELLLGDIVNTNAPWISKKLAALGIDVYHHITVGDNPARIQSVIQQALDRADILIFTGGLGPTEDDLTIATIADYFNAALIEDPASVEAIKAFFIARGIEHTSNNLKQALKPQDAQTIENPIGTAPGIAWDVSSYLSELNSESNDQLHDELAKRTSLILTFPGVPRELYAMWPASEAFIKQQMEKQGLQSQMLTIRFLHFFGIGESKVALELADLMDGQNPTVAPYVGRSEVRIRIAAKASNEADALALIEPIKKQAIERLKPFYFAEGKTTDDVNIEAIVADILKDKKLTVSVAESCTGGLVSSRLTDVPGSSQYTSLNVVTYSNHQKEQLLNVCPEDLKNYGAVSPQIASTMAQNILKISNCDVGLALTGLAGPDGGSDEKPIGLLYLALTGLNQTIVKKILVNPNYPRTDIKYWFSQYALHYLRQYLQGTLQTDN